MKCSNELFARAKRVMPGGVNSPVRAFGAMGIDPPFIERGKGSRIWDVEGREYLDHMLSWGPLILGHAPEAVVEAVEKQVRKGATFGACTELEVLVAEEIRELIPSVEVIRMVSSGTEATMSALRLARGFTGRDIIVKFEGCYHGHSDSLLIKAGSGALTHGAPDSAGVPRDIAQNTIISKYNDISMAKEIFERYGEDIAGVIVEPIAGNMGTVAPKPGFLHALRELTERAGALLIFDEVITGFRVGLSGAQGLYHITPDITTLGKIIGGGLPVGAYGGREDIMRKVSPEGPVYQAGTLSGNPLAMAAGLATVSQLRKDPHIYERLDRNAEKLCDGLKGLLGVKGIPNTINRVGSMMTMFFTPLEVLDYDTAITSDVEMYSRYFKAMLQEGIYLPPSQFETFFISSAHTDDDIEKTLSTVEKVISAF